MKTKNLLFLSVIMAACTSCDKSSIAPHEDATLLHERFHGKYKIVNSTSDEAVDVNRDGQASTNLLQEIDYLSDAELELRIPMPGHNTDGTPFLFTQWWQQQFISPGNADTLVNYALQGVVRHIKFSPNMDSILVAPDDHQVDLELFPLPNAVTVESDDLIRVVVQKLLYTKDGWKPIRITTLYKRYTMVT